MNAIKTVGNQTFLSSNNNNNIAINLAHVIKVIDVEYCIYNEEGEKLEESAKGFGILTSDDRWTYFGDIKGDYKENKYWYTVYADSNLVEELKKFF